MERCKSGKKLSNNSPPETQKGQKPENAKCLEEIKPAVRQCGQTTTNKEEDSPGSERNLETFANAQRSDGL